MELIAKKEIGLIKPGMRFAFIRELDEFIEVFCVDLQLHFRLSKKIIHENFDFRY